MDLAWLFPWLLFLHVLGAIVAFLFLIYIISLITLFGAHLSAAIESWERDRMTPVAA